MGERVGPEDCAEAFRMLSDSERIDILSYLKDEDQTTLEELSHYMESLGYEAVPIQLIHQHLPLMQDYGIIEKEADIITYREDEFIEEIIEKVEEHYTPSRFEPSKY